MPVVRGCALPDELLYDVENNIWYRDLGDGTFRLGMTAVAVAMAGPLVAFVPRRPGRRLEAGRSCATVESGKWVGPARIAFDGEVVAVNERLSERPQIANGDPYGDGWMLVVRPDDRARALALLVPGGDVAAPYEAKMQAEGFAGCVPP